MMYRKVLLLAVTALVVVHAVGPDARAVQSQRRGAKFKVGQTTFAAADNTEFKLGRKTLKMLAKDTPVEIILVDGAWIGGKVTIDGEVIEGWIRRGDLSLVASEPKTKAAETASDSKSTTKEKPVVPAKSAAAASSAKSDAKPTEKSAAGQPEKSGDRVADKFARLMAAKELAVEGKIEKPGKAIAKQPPTKTPAPPKADAPKADVPKADVPKADVPKTEAPKLKPVAAPAEKPGKTDLKAATKQPDAKAETPDSKSVAAPKQPEVTKAGPPEVKKPSGAKVAKSPAKAPAKESAGSVPKPAAAKPAAAKPAAAKPAAAKPAAAKPAAAKPAAAKPAAAKPAADDIGEGPEAMAEKFAQILAKRRGEKPAGKATEKPAAKPAVKPVAKAATPPAPRGKPAAAAAPAVPAVDQAPTINVLVLRVADDLADVPASQRIGQLILSGDQFTNKSLRQLEGLSVEALSIEAVNVTNAGLQYVSKVRGLRWLRLWSPGLDDNGLKHLAQLDALTTLDIEGTAVTGAGFGDLKGLQKLELLVLGPKTSDAELAQLKNLPALEKLDLRACGRLTVACLESLGSLTNLKVIWLPSHIRTKGKRALRETLPECQIRS